MFSQHAIHWCFVGLDFPHLIAVDMEWIKKKKGKRWRLLFCAGIETG